MATKVIKNKANKVNNATNLQFSYEPEGTNLLGQDAPETIKTTTSQCNHGLKGVLNVGIKSVKSDKTLNDLQDINIDTETLSEGDILVYNKQTAQWENKKLEDYYSGLVLDGNFNFDERT